MKKLNIWTLSKEYVDEMSTIDSSVQYPKPNNGHTRPYVGIVLTIFNFLYFAPLTHQGQKWYGYEDHVLIEKGKFGSIKLNKMIPIYNIYKDELLTPISIDLLLNSNNAWEFNRGKILSKEWRFINKPDVVKQILTKAANVYFNWNSLTKKQEYHCNFQKLEYFAINWKFIYYKLVNLINNYSNNTIY